MEQRPSVVLGRLRHRGNDCITIQFEKDFVLIGAVKTVPGATFSWTRRCWYVVDGKGVLESIRCALQDKAIIDDTALREPDPANAAALRAYREQLERMRYSENTRKMYINYFGNFLRYFQDTPADAIGDDQIDRYMQYLLVLLDSYVLKYGPRSWLFEGSSGEQYSVSSLQKVFNAGAAKVRCAQGCDIAYLAAQLRDPFA